MFFVVHIIAKHGHLSIVGCIILQNLLNSVGLCRDGQYLLLILGSFLKPENKLLSISLCL